MDIILFKNYINFLSSFYIKLNNIDSNIIIYIQYFCHLCNFEKIINYLFYQCANVPNPEKIKI